MPCRLRYAGRGRPAPARRSHMLLASRGMRAEMGATLKNHDARTAAGKAVGDSGAADPGTNDRTSTVSGRSPIRPTGTTRMLLTVLLSNKPLARQIESQPICGPSMALAAVRGNDRPISHRPVCNLPGSNAGSGFAPVVAWGRRMGRPLSRCGVTRLNGGNGRVVAETKTTVTRRHVRP